MKLILLPLFVSLVACTSLTKKNADNTLNQEDQTESFARARAASVKNVSYDLHLKLNKDKEVYSGTQKIIFDLRDLTDTYLDFQGGTIISANLNGQEIDIERGPVHMLLPKSALRHERNMLTLLFSHEYSRSGTGLHRFVDPEDQNVYLYTDFQPFDASKMAPFFDQPDIRATLSLKVDAPADWQVVGNGRLFLSQPKSDGF